MIVQIIRTFTRGAEGCGFKSTTLFETSEDISGMFKNLQTFIFTECKLFIWITFNRSNSINTLIHEQKRPWPKRGFEGLLAEGNWTQYSRSTWWQRYLKICQFNFIRAEVVWHEMYKIAPGEKHTPTLPYAQTHTCTRQCTCILRHTHACRVLLLRPDKSLSTDPCLCTSEGAEGEKGSERNELVLLICFNSYDTTRPNLP